MTTPAPAVKDRILVVAGNLAQAKDWARATNRDPYSWIYVNDTNMLFGRHRPTYVLWGTYYARPDWEAIRQRLVVVQAQRLEE